jgi:hypothetical protein
VFVCDYRVWWGCSIRIHLVDGQQPDMGFQGLHKAGVFSLAARLLGVLANMVYTHAVMWHPCPLDQHIPQYKVRGLGGEGWGRGYEWHLVGHLGRGVAASSRSRTAPGSVVLSLRFQLILIRSPPPDLPLPTATDHTCYRDWTLVLFLYHIISAAKRHP